MGIEGWCVAKTEAVPRDKVDYYKHFVEGSMNTLMVSHI